MGLQSIGTLGFASQVLNAVPSPHLSQEQVYVLQATSVQGTGFMLFLVSSPLKLSQVGVPWGNVYKRYIWYYYSIGSLLIVRPQNA